ncbi:DUF3592 domain-containing protein [Kosakonia pseudosacchari]|uniref:DUF3592 domain-containing protein n=1 Tax=Kosakonia pseudosacchari TaxID=1646340 RepID=UPI00187F40AF|nr:DUF3592 domain-containing protein [Kosakonia pseudosacchari]QOV62209.1 hypothetical protein IP581_13075 [Kosakonia pseudosacchari]
MSDSTMWSIALTVLIIAWLIYGIMKAGYDDDKFRAKGIKVEARIVDKKNIGVSGTGNIKYKVVVEFETRNGVVRAQTKRYFTPEDLIKVMRKNTVQLFYLPEDPQQIYLVPQDME